MFKQATPFALTTFSAVSLPRQLDVSVHVRVRR